MSIDSACPDCGEPIHVAVKDGQLEAEEPPGLVGHVAVLFGQWMNKIPFA